MEEEEERDEEGGGLDRRLGPEAGLDPVPPAIKASAAS